MIIKIKDKIMIELYIIKIKDENKIIIELFFILIKIENNWIIHYNNENWKK